VEFLEDIGINLATRDCFNSGVAPFVDSDSEDDDKRKQRKKKPHNCAVVNSIAAGCASVGVKARGFDHFFSKRSS
jgi:hypothetical protein